MLKATIPVFGLVILTWVWIIVSVYRYDTYNDCNFPENRVS